MPRRHCDVNRYTLNKYFLVLFKFYLKYLSVVEIASCPFLPGGKILDRKIEPRHIVSDEYFDHVSLCLYHQKVCLSSSKFSMIINHFLCLNEFID